MTTIINENITKKIINEYTQYEAVPNKYCVDIPIGEGNDIKQFAELARFYTHYHLFISSKKEFMEKAPADQPLTEKNIAWLKAEKKMLDEYALKAKSKVYPIYKQVNIFKDFENVFMNEINDKLKQYVRKLNIENMVPIQELKERYVIIEKNKKINAHIIIHNKNDENKGIENELAIYRKYVKVLYIYKHIMRN